jgi:ComF family protein
LSNRAAAILNQCFKLVRAAPVSCVLCGALTEGERVCGGCDSELPRLPRMRCGICALPLPSGGTCGACLHRKPHYDAVTAAYAYAYPVDALIQAYKYGARLSIAPVLAQALAREASPGIDALVPMPLAPARLRSRGFNQAHELARSIGRALRAPVLSGGCRKVTDTPPQAELPWSARAANVRGAFVCDVDMTGKRLAIIDDVMTTGSTIDELARVLKRAGAAHVSGWVVARTLR